MVAADGFAMNRTGQSPVQFVDDGYPEAQDYDNNYIPVASHKRPAAAERSVTKTIRVFFRLARQRLTRLRPGRRLIAS